MNKNLPIFKAVIDDIDEGILSISLVDYPAIQRDFVAFKEDKIKEQFSVQDEEQRIISGALMLANTPIYRRSADGREYYIVYEPATIRIMAEKLFSDNNQNNIDILHNGELIDGINLIELFIKDASKGISPNYLEDIPDGSLMATYKVRNDEVWDKIKSGELKGYSLLGLFSISQEESVDSEEDELEEILSMLKKLKNIK